MLMCVLGARFLAHRRHAASLTSMPTLPICADPSDLCRPFRSVPTLPICADPSDLCLPPPRFSDSEVQRDAKLVSYQIVDKQTKPYIQGRCSVEGRCTHKQSEPSKMGLAF